MSLSDFSYLNNSRYKMLKQFVYHPDDKPPEKGLFQLNCPARFFVLFLSINGDRFLLEQNTMSIVFLLAKRFFPVVFLLRSVSER